VTRTHTTLISLILGLVVVLGVLAATRTTALATRPNAVSAVSITARQQRLNRAEAQLRRALTRRPPALPTSLRASPAAATTRITYVRPAPIVVPSASVGEHGDHEDEGGEGFDD
jgi:hypothetical protein